MFEGALDIEHEAVDASFDLDSWMQSDVHHLQENFCADWICYIGSCVNEREHLDLFTGTFDSTD